MRIAPDVASLLLPQRCAGCRLEGEVLCARCRAALVPVAPPLCARCGAPTSVAVGRCRECAGRRLAFASARAAVVYRGPAVAFVREWKEAGRRGLDALAAELVRSRLAAPEADAISFVPAVRDRALWRGHNPAERLARALSPPWLLPVAPLLVRASSPRRQRGLPLGERRRNVARAFVAPGPVPRRVVLVDDVYTSGATVAAAASALRAAGARRVDVVTLARAPRQGEWVAVR
ncbi:MAG: double zinc ribbon domain-containing protein [Thermoleophilia bacterium]